LYFYGGQDAEPTRVSSKLVVWLNSQLLEYKWCFPTTDRLSLERASLGFDRISAEVQYIQASQGLQRFGVSNLIVAEEHPSQFSQRLQGLDVRDFIVVE
jgi:hypothetical protein